MVSAAAQSICHMPFICPGGRLYACPGRLSHSFLDQIHSKGPPIRPPDHQPIFFERYELSTKRGPAGVHIAGDLHIHQGSKLAQFPAGDEATDGRDNLLRPPPVTDAGEGFRQGGEGKARYRSGDLADCGARTGPRRWIGGVLNVDMQPQTGRRRQSKFADHRRSRSVSRQRQAAASGCAQRRSKTESMAFGADEGLSVSAFHSARRLTSLSRTSGPRRVREPAHQGATVHPTVLG